MGDFWNYLNQDKGDVERDGGGTKKAGAEEPDGSIPQKLTPLSIKPEANCVLLQVNLFLYYYRSFSSNLNSLYRSRSLQSTCQ